MSYKIQFIGHFRIDVNLAYFPRRLTQIFSWSADIHRHIQAKPETEISFTSDLVERFPL